MTTTGRRRSVRRMNTNALGQTHESIVRRKKSEGKGKKMLINTTPHDINLYRESDAALDAKTRKLIAKPGAKPYRTIPASGTLLNAKATEELLDPVEGVTVKSVVWKTDSLPNDGNFYIVSALYKSAASAKDAKRLLAVGGVVYDNADNPRPIGCTYLVK